MRTTLQINDEIMVTVKRMAAESRKTLTEVIEALLLAGLNRRAEADRRDRVKLPVFRGGTGVAPGIDIDRTGELLTSMDEERWHAAD